jgi:ankyrin repeat protein
MWASWAGSISIVDLLVVHGADANVQNSRGETALHWAAAAGHLDVCQYLFDHLGGTSFLKQPDQSGRTPLDYAKLYQRKEVVDWLTETIYSKKMIKSSIWA